MNRHNWIYALAGLALAAFPAFGQLPAGAEQASRLMQEQSEQVQERLRQSGLTPGQLRQRLRSMGLDPSMLDPFLAAEVDPGTTVSADVLRTLDLLGVPEVMPGAADQTLRALGRRDSMIASGARSRVFGLDVFRGRTTQFQPSLTGPVPDTYRVGPGDMMVLVLTGDVELAHPLQVTREGFVVIPQVGQLYVNNLTMAALRQLFRARLERSYSGIPRGTTLFDLTLARLRTIQVFVLGDVVQPGAYQLSSAATVLNGLYAAGGPTEQGNLRDVRVERRGNAAGSMDLYDYLLKGSTARDVPLEHGDIVFVPVQGPRVAVEGGVTRPAVYELRPGETLADLVSMAGGFRPDAELRRIAVHRILSISDRSPAPAPRVVVDVPLRPGARDRNGDGGGAGTRDTLSPMIPRLTLESGDSVVVDTIVPANISLHLTITGTVTKPGTYPWRAGITLRDLVLLARGPLPGADLREAEIARLPADRSTGALAKAFRVPLDSTYLLERDSLGRYLGAAGVSFPAGGAAPEVVLEPYDQVTVFRQPGFELQRTVIITGEVPFPGHYALGRKDERLSDLVQRAGGPLPTAYLAGARFVRSLDSAGRVNAKLERALRDPAGNDDLVLQPADSLHIPEFIPIVRVTGAVNSPTSVRYEAGRGLDYYVANSGGYAGLADKKRVSVRYADGSARVRRSLLFLKSYPEPLPGSTIVVPSKPAEQGVDWAVVMGGLAQVMSAVTTMILVVERLR